jgi:hypothetical protein
MSNSIETKNQKYLLPFIPYTIKQVILINFRIIMNKFKN